MDQIRESAVTETDNEDPSEQNLVCTENSNVACRVYDYSKRIVFGVLRYLAEISF